MLQALPFAMRWRDMAWQFEHTDTFGGEANYCWVRREIRTDLGGKSNRAVVRALKAFAEFTGLRCQTYSNGTHGDFIEVRPVGRHAPCQIAFATWCDAPERED